MILVVLFVIAGAIGSFYFESLVPGVLCLIMALCAYVWQVVSKLGDK